MGFQSFFFFFLKRNGVKWTEIIRKSNFFSLFRVFSRSGMKGYGAEWSWKIYRLLATFLGKDTQKKRALQFCKDSLCEFQYNYSVVSRFLLGLSTLKFFVSKVVVRRWLRVFGYIWCHWAIPIILSRGKLFHRPNPSFFFLFSSPPTPQPLTLPSSFLFFLFLFSFFSKKKFSFYFPSLSFIFR